MKTLLTAEILPRISSGVRVSINVPRMTTLMLSSAPSAPRANNDRTNEREHPKMMVARPKPVTANNNVLPACCMGRRWARSAAIESAPMDGMARSQPKPVAPTFRMSVA